MVSLLVNGHIPDDKVDVRSVRLTRHGEDHQQQVVDGTREEVDRRQNVKDNENKEHELFKIIHNTSSLFIQIPASELVSYVSGTSPLYA